MSTPYFNDVAVTDTYAPLVAAASRGTQPTRPGDLAGQALGSTGIRFTGSIRAKSTNSADIVIQSVANNTVSGTIGATDTPLRLEGVDLSQIQVKSTQSGAIVQLAGKIDII